MSSSEQLTLGAKLCAMFNMRRSQQPATVRRYRNLLPRTAAVVDVDVEKRSSAREARSLPSSILAYAQRARKMVVLLGLPDIVTDHA